jgi:hypothetical protein
LQFIGTFFVLPSGTQPVLVVPLNSFLDGLFETRELKIWQYGAQLSIAGCFLKLPVRLGRVKFQPALIATALG